MLKIYKMWVDFDDLSLQSRVWVFQCNRFLAPEEQDSIDVHLKSYLDRWSTHRPTAGNAWDTLQL